MTVTLKNMALSLIVITILVFGSFGCEHDHGDMMVGGSNSDALSDALIVSVYPADGTAGVPINSAIAVKFAGPMDTTSVMNNLYIAFGQNMHDWMDSATHYEGVGHMSDGHTDHMSGWMDSIAISGAFHWNEAMDSCEFFPDPPMMSNQEHMILMYEGGMVGHGGGMMGSDHGDDEYYRYHFTTGQ